MTVKYKTPSLQKLYESLLALAPDRESELYLKGLPRTGAGHRAAFWDGFSGKYTFRGPKSSANVIPGTLSAAAFMAGREWARQVAKASREAHHGGAGRGQGRKPKDSDGELMGSRTLRMTDAEWADAKFVGMDELRQWVKTRAAEIRLASAGLT